MEAICLLAVIVAVLTTGKLPQMYINIYIYIYIYINTRFTTIIDCDLLQDRFITLRTQRVSLCRAWRCDFKAHAVFKAETQIYRLLHYASQRARSNLPMEWVAPVSEHISRLPPFIYQRTTNKQYFNEYTF